MADATDPVTVEVVHLSQLRAALRRAGPGLVEQVKQVNYDVANTIAQGARQKASGQGGAAGKAAPSIRAIRSSASSQVRIGGARYPYALGAEFGSLRYRQFKTWRGNQWQPWGSDGVGYFLHPTIRDHREQTMKQYGDSVERIMQSAFPE